MMMKRLTAAAAKAAAALAIIAAGAASALAQGQGQQNVGPLAGALARQGWVATGCSSQAVRCASVGKCAARWRRRATRPVRYASVGKWGTMRVSHWDEAIKNW